MAAMTRTVDPRSPVIVFPRHWIAVGAGNNVGSLQRPVWAAGPVNGWRGGFGHHNDNRRSA